MKTTEEYLIDYLDKKNELSEKGELWRLRVTQEEFLAEIERLRVSEIYQKKSNSLSEYHIQKNVEEMIAALLMGIATLDEMREQTNMIMGID